MEKNLKSIYHPLNSLMTTTEEMKNGCRCKKIILTINCLERYINIRQCKNALRRPHLGATLLKDRPSPFSILIEFPHNKLSWSYHIKLFRADPTPIKVIPSRIDLHNFPFSTRKWDSTAVPGTRAFPEQLYHTWRCIKFWHRREMRSHADSKVSQCLLSASFRE